MKAKTNYTFLQKTKLLLLLVLLFISTLQIPRISILAFLCIPASLVLSYFLNTSPILTLNSRLIKKTNFLLCLGLIVVFSLTFYTATKDYGFYEKDPPPILFYTCLIAIYYILGACLNYKKLPYYPFNLAFIFLFLIGGGIVFVWLSITHTTNLSLTDIAVAERKVPSFWRQDADPINGPALDIFSMLGISLFPVILHGRDTKERLSINIAIYLIALTLFVMSFYSSLALLARTPIIAFIISMFITTIFAIVKGQNKNKIFRVLLLLLLLLVLLANFQEIISQLFGSFYDINPRFLEEGFETPRYELWKTALEKIFDYPLGGRSFSLPTGARYAHNIWLDTAYDAGLLPMILLILFHGLHLGYLVKILFLELPRVLIITILCMAIGFMMAFIGTPVLQASLNYFSISCFFLGAITRLSIMNKPSHELWENMAIGDVNLDFSERLR